MASLARQIGEPARAVQLRQATVTAAPSGGTATVRFGTGATAIAGVRHLGTAAIANGDTVWVLQQGYDLLIVGKVGAGGTIAGSVTIGGSLTVTGAVTVQGEPLQFPSTVTNNKINLWGTEYSLGVQSHTFLLRSGGTTGANVFLFEKSDGTDLVRIDPNGLVVAGAGQAHPAYIGQHPVHTSGWAAMGHNAHAGSGTLYAFMQHSDGRAYVNGDFVRVLTKGATRIHVTDTWVTVYTPLTATGGAIGGESIIGTWSTNHASMGRNGTVNLSGGNPMGFMMRNDGRCWIGATSTAGNGISFRMNGVDKYIFSDSGGIADVRFAHLYAVTGNVPVEVGSSSGQLFKTSSSGRFKRNITDLPRPARLDDSPVLRARPRRFHWRDDDPNAPPEAHHLNARFPDGIPGFIAEELAEVAPDCVVWEEDAPVLGRGGEGPESLDGDGERDPNWAGPRPVVTNQTVLITHLVQAVQVLHERLAAIERLPAVGVGTGGN